MVKKITIHLKLNLVRFRCCFEPLVLMRNSAVVWISQLFLASLERREQQQALNRAYHRCDPSARTETLANTSEHGS